MDTSYQERLFYLGNSQCGVFGGGLLLGEVRWENGWEGRQDKHQLPSHLSQPLHFGKNRLRLLRDGIEKRL